MVVDLLADDTRADLVFNALADATRRDIVRRSFSGELSVSALARGYAMSVTAVQKHVAILERAGLVAKHRNGRRKVVKTELGALLIAQGLLKRYEDMWRERFDRMAQLISETAETKEKDSRPLLIRALIRTA